MIAVGYGLLRSGDCGLQRLQARKPARSGSSGVSKKRTLVRFGSRDEQAGRQYTPVVRTPYQNTLSARWSRRISASQRSSSVAKVVVVAVTIASLIAQILHSV